MLTLVRLHASERYHSLVSCHDGLPTRFYRTLGAAVRCQGVEFLAATLRWYRECGERQEVFPLALVVPRDAAITRHIVLEATAPAALLFDDEISGAHLPDEVVELLWHRGILLQLEEATLRETGVELTQGERAVLRKVIAAGAEGRRAAGAAACVRMSQSTLRRWLAERGLPPVGRLLRTMRVEAVRRLQCAGMDPATASRLCGWSGRRASRLACMRAGGRGRAATAA